MVIDKQLPSLSRITLFFHIYKHPTLSPSQFNPSLYLNRQLQNLVHYFSSNKRPILQTSMALETLNSPTAAGPSFPFESATFSYLDQSWTKGKQSKRPHIEEHHPNTEEYLALCLLMLARGATKGNPSPPETKAAPPVMTSPPSVEMVFKCSVCDKAFSSYQALGGHKASHSQRKSSVTAEGCSVTTSSGSVSSRAHECSICHRCFPSGQALGGHKRRHYEGPIGKSATSNSSGVTSSEGVRSTNSHRNFDLNMPAFPGFLTGDDEVESPHPSKKPRLVISLKL